MALGDYLRIDRGGTWYGVSWLGAPTWLPWNSRPSLPAPVRLPGAAAAVRPGARGNGATGDLQLLCPFRGTPVTGIEFTCRLCRHAPSRARPPSFENGLLER